MHARIVEGVTPFNNELQMQDVTANLNVNSDLGRAMLDRHAAGGDDRLS